MQFKTPLYWRLNYTVLLFYKEFHSTPSALNTAPFWRRKPERGCVDEGEMKGIPDYRFSSNCSTVTVALPSAAKVMPSADSDPEDQRFESSRSHQEQYLMGAALFVLHGFYGAVKERIRTARAPRFASRGAETFWWGVSGARLGESLRAHLKAHCNVL